MPSRKQWLLIYAALIVGNLSGVAYYYPRGQIVFVAVHTTLAALIAYLAYREKQLASLERERRLKEDILDE